MAGTYLPTSDRYDPRTASSADLALAAYALGRRAAILTAADENHPAAVEARRAVRRAAVQLNQLIGQQNAVMRVDAVTYALLLLTLVESPGMNDFKIQRDWLVLKL